MAPDTQPAYISAASLSLSGNSPLITTSETQRCPPGFSTLTISEKAFTLSGTRFSTQLLMTTSTESASTGIFSMSPRRNSTLWKWSLSAFILALEIIASVISTPITVPDSPTRALATKQSLPAPEPRSRTASPFLICANSVGIPQPSPRSASG